MDQATFEQHFKDARYNNLSVVVRYREPDGSLRGCFVAYAYRIYEGRAVVLFNPKNLQTDKMSLELLLSDIYEVY